jgi:hypothetical protein
VSNEREAHIRANQIQVFLYLPLTYLKCFSDIAAAFSRLLSNVLDDPPDTPNPVRC